MVSTISVRRRAAGVILSAALALTAVAAPVTMAFAADQAAATTAETAEAATSTLTVSQKDLTDTTGWYATDDSHASAPKTNENRIPGGLKTIQAGTYVISYSSTGNQTSEGNYSIITNTTVDKDGKLDYEGGNDKPSTLAAGGSTTITLNGGDVIVFPKSDLLGDFTLTPASTSTVKGDANGDGKADAQDLKDITASVKDKDGNVLGLAQGFDPVKGGEVKIPQSGTGIDFTHIPDGWTVKQQDNKLVFDVLLDGTDTPVVTYTFTPSEDGAVDPEPTDPNNPGTPGEVPQSFTVDVPSSGVITDTAIKLGVPEGNYTVAWKSGAKAGDAKLKIGSRATAGTIADEDVLYTGSASSDGAFTLKDANGNPVDHVVINNDTVISVEGLGSAVFTHWDGKDPVAKPTDVKVDGALKKTVAELNLVEGDYTAAWKAEEKANEAAPAIVVTDKDGNVVYTGTVDDKTGAWTSGAFAFKDANGRPVDHVTLAKDNVLSITGHGTVTFNPYTAPAKNDQQNNAGTDLDKLPQTGMAAVATLIAGLGLTGAGATGVMLRRRNASK